MHIQKICPKETLACVKGINKLLARTQSHRTQEHQCQDLSKERQSCYCYFKRNSGQTSDREFQPVFHLQELKLQMLLVVLSKWNANNTFRRYRLRSGFNLSIALCEAGMQV
ncbi:hypothetical protein ILYODFUR_003409 [Ilyodon furcidens]|uniref:Uncharacterized protein n=1 Tax=Ilyodon furcidens TaxID=33524 RepID=A0ABV0VBE2_9TELE